MAPGSAETPLPRVSTETTEVTETSNGFNRIREALPGPGYFSFHTASSTSTVNLEEPQIVIYGRALDKIKVSKVERKASLRDDKDREPSNTVLFWLCSTIALKGVATQLIFACQKALQENLDFQLSHFAALTTVQMILTNLAGPFWAALADRGTLEKKTILIVGCLGEGISATCFAFVPNFTMMMVVRAFSGFFLAALRPICNGIVADLTSENRRGKVFGRVQGALLCGMFVSDLIAVNMANQSYWLAGANRYLPGWRFLFAAAGVLSMTLALLLRFFLSEPPSVREIRDIRSEVKPASFLTIVGQELCAVIQFLRMPTFLILVFIGIFATIPWSVFGQKIFFFQLCGLKDWQVSILPAANKATAMLGTILGGRMGDCFARLGRFGRPLCAQLALAIAIPVMFLQFYGLPPGEGLFWVYLVLIVVFSIFGFWPQCAANLPILSGIVPAEDSCKVMAWQSAFENCLAHAVGPPMISVLSSAFGYSFDDNPEHSHELNLERARALGKAMAATMCIPWLIAMVAYTCLYWSYPRDMGKLYASLSALLG